VTDIELRKLSALRSLLEGFAGHQAALHTARDSSPLVSLRGILKRLNEAIRQRNYVAFRDADYELHEAIVMLADVPLLREAWLLVWKALQGFHRQAALARWVHLSALPKHKSLGDEAREVLVHSMWLPGFGDSGHVVPRHAQTPAPLV